MGGRGASGGGSGASAGLPESFTATLDGYKIVDGRVNTPTGANIDVRYVDPLTQKQLDMVAQSGRTGEYIFVNSQYLMPKNVAEKALQQKAQIKENYQKNLEQNVPGLAKLEKAIDDKEAHYQISYKAIERGAQPPKAPAVSPAQVAKEYPRAAAYIKAQNYERASNYTKSAIGREAMNKIRQGAPVNKTIKAMESEWERKNQSQWQ